MNPTDSAGLLSTLRKQLSLHGHDCLFTASMDHSPSEQLEGNRWHTTVLVLSSGLEHAELARQIAAEIRPRNGHLRRWKGRPPEPYRSRFARSLCELFPGFPVYVFAISARADAIRASECHFVEQLGLHVGYRKLRTEEGKMLIQLGPVLRGQERKKLVISLVEHRGLMVLFMSHFVIRMYDMMVQALRSASQRSDAVSLRWNFLADKLPGATNTDMDLMFNAVLGLNRPHRSIVWGYFADGNRVETDLLVDNVAGLISQCANNPDDGTELLSIEPGLAGGLFYWEKWD